MVKSKIGKKTYTRKYTPKKKTAQIAKSVFNKLTETKEVFINSGGTSIGFYDDGIIIPLCATGTVTSATYLPIPQGTGDGQRVGDIVHLKSLKLKIRLNGSVAMPDVTRVIIFRWRPNIPLNTDAGLFTSLGPLVLYDGLGNNYTSAMSPYNNKKTQYTILKDYTLMLHTYQPAKVLNIYVNLKGITAEFTGDGTSSSHSMTNQIFCMIVGEGSVSNLQNFNLSSVIQYKDG